MIKKIITLIIFLNSFFSFSQVANDSLVNTLKDAEKILITSHEDFELIINKPGKSRTIKSTLLKNGRPNNRIIKEYIKLDSKLKQELIEIISTQKNNGILYDAYCFQPHHTIFIYKEKKWSYIDICFGCYHYSYSEDLNINKKNFLSTDEDWKRLEIFFRKQNLNYNMPKSKNNNNN